MAVFFNLVLEYRTIWELMGMIAVPQREGCQKLFEENKRLFSMSAGSSHNHHEWRGGYIDHVREVMNIACVDYSIYSRVRKFPFELSDALLVLYLHDLEKPWKYCGDDAVRARLKTKPERHAFRLEKIAEYGISLTFEHENAIRYVEGEGDDYSPGKRIMGELASFCHRCDVASARIWHDRPAKDGDTWGNALRFIET